MQEMTVETVEAQGPLPPKGRKAYKGIAMEGFIAKWYSKTGKNRIEEYKSWAKLASDNTSEGGEVLEVAPGPGYLSIELAKLGRNYKIIGLDISKTFVSIAQEKARDARVRIEFRQGDAAYMPFPTDSFDSVICTAAFKNFPEPVKVLDEIFRVLKAGGRALIVDLRKDVTKAQINEYVHQMNLNRINSFFTKLSFKHLLLKWAFTKGQIEDLVTSSKFGGCEILDEGIGVEIWMTKE
jgi:ubiquinone/menaquinone biosynthesis C-methylase UbiE